MLSNSALTTSCFLHLLFLFRSFCVMHLCCLTSKSWLGPVLLWLRDSMVFHETLSQLEVKRKTCCPARSTFSVIFLVLFMWTWLPIRIKPPLVPQHKWISLAVASPFASYLLPGAFKGFYSLFIATKSKLFGNGIQCSSEVEWKCFLLEIGWMDEQNFRVESLSNPAALKVRFQLD